MIRILIDSDVLLDFFFGRKPFAFDAKKIIGLCESKKVAGFVSPVMLSNLYYILRQTTGKSAVIDHLKKLLLIVDVLEMNRTIILEALDSGFGDFEDALQNFTATASGKIDSIVTRNVKDYKKSALSVMCPADFLGTIGA